MGVISVQTDANVFRFGTQSLKCITGDTGDNAIYPADPVAVQPDESRTFSAYIKTEAPITDGSIYLRVAQGGLFTPVLIESDPITDTASDPAADADGWLRVIVTLTIPSGVFTVRPYLQYTGTTALQVFWVDGIKFERGAVASIWQENIVSGRAVVDQSGFIVDASKGGIVRYLGAAGGSRDTVSLGDHGLVFGGDTEVYSPATGELSVDGQVLAGVPSGAMVMWGAAAAPSGWLLCDGTSYLRADYADLFAVIGTTYGSADGTHFNVPDLRQRFPLGKAASGTGSALGGTGGAIDHTHTGASHTHTSASHSHSHSHQTPFSGEGTGIFFKATPAFGEGSSYTPNQYANTGNPTGTSNYDNTDTDASATTPGATGATTPGAGGTGNPPYLVVNFVIKV